MKIQILRCNNYIPFDLYFNTIYNIFETHDYFKLKNCEVSIIEDISLLKEDTNFLFLFLNFIDKIYDIDKSYNINTNNIKIIFINADCIFNHTEKSRKNINYYLNCENKDNTYIWDYSSFNIEYYNKNFLNKKYYFIPLIYNNYLEDIYKPNKLGIPFNERSIDILFLGNSSERRRVLIDNINKKYNIVIKCNINNIDEYIYYIENSKIILNIFSQDYNKSFDYYRCSLLFSNKNIVLTEKFTSVNFASVNFDIEKNLLELNKYLCFFEPDNINDTIENYLNKPQKEIENITENIYENFKKFDIVNYIIEFFDNLENQSYKL